MQISELVQLPESGEEQSVVFVVPADEFEALRVAEAGEEWRLWVVEGQCSRVQARGDAGRGSGAGTWSLAVVAAICPQSFTAIIQLHSDLPGLRAARDGRA